MKEWSFYIIAPIAIFSLGFLYVWLAPKFRILDDPDGRSSHKNTTITGFGIIFPLALAVYSVFYPYTLPSFFIIGFLMLTVISFIDDIVFVKHFIRLIFQIFGLVLMAMELPLTSAESDKLLILIACVIFGIGVINAYNFMDGINGMLGLNALITVLSLLYLNEYSTDLQGQQIKFVRTEFIVTVILALLVFLFFNLRSNAVVFAGDAGSIAISFMILYMMYCAIITTGNYSYLLLFAVVGVDSGITVIYKLILKENIFVPHRDFLFKKLAHIGKYPHKYISMVYAAIQAVVSIIVISLPLSGKLSAQLSTMFITVVLLVATYIIVRNRFTKQRIVRFTNKQDM